MASFPGARPRRQARAKETTALRQGPWLGSRDSLDPSSAAPELATLLYNVYPGGLRGEGVWGRPGIKPLGERLPGVGAVQRVYEYVKPDTSRITVGFRGGLFYHYDWAGGVWIPLALGGGVVVDPAVRVYCTTFAGLLVVSDGVNKPWTWDGNGAFTVLTNAPVAYGPPTVYAAKLFFIKKLERNAIVWSEENQPNVGYEATIGPTTYVNAWGLVQVRHDALTAIFAEEGALYYFRTTSTGMITGEVTDDFQTTATHDAVSGEIGTESPDTIVRAGPGRIYLLDSNGHPQLLQHGRYRGEDAEEAIPIWHDCRETTRRIPRAQLGLASAIEVPELELILFSVVDYWGPEPGLMLAFHGGTGQYVGQFGGFAARCLAVARDQDGARTLILGDASGDVYRLGRPMGDVWDDHLRSGTKPIQHVIEGSPMGWDEGLDKAFTLFMASVRAATSLTGLRFSYVTPAHAGAEIDVQALGFAAIALWDSSEWETAEWPADTLEGRVVVGLDRNGRYAQPRLAHLGAGEEFGVLSFSVMATLQGLDPFTP